MLQFYIVVKTFFAAISLDYEVVTHLTLPGLFIFLFTLTSKLVKIPPHIMIKYPAQYL